MTSFATGLHAYRRAHRLLADPAFRRYLWLPGFISLAYMMLLVWVGGAWIGEAVTWMHTAWVPSFLQGAVVGFLLNIVLWALLLVAILLTYRPLVLIVTAPLLGKLSEDIERQIRPASVPATSALQVVHDLWRAVLVNGYSLFWSLLLSLGAWLLGFVPLLGAFIAPPLLFLIQAYYSAMGLADPPLERRQYSVKATVQHARQHRLAMLGVGTGFMLILLIPILGWFLAPAYGTVAATLLTLDLLPEDASPGKDLFLEE